MAIDKKKLAAFVEKETGKNPFAKGKKKAAPEEVDVEAIGEKVQNGKGDKELMKLAKGITEETNPPETIEDEDTWEKAKKAVQPKWDDYDEPYAVVMSVYKAMGGKFKKGKK